MEIQGVDIDYPIFFEQNRVWRCYKGGKLLDIFRGNSEAEDSNLPEEWLASTTLAANGERSQSEHEGVSMVRTGVKGSPVLLSDLIKAAPEEILGRTSADSGVGVLCKFLDSSVRLPVQCHPDRTFARKFLNSPNGKAESWLVLDTREINGEKPYLLMGFKAGTKKEDFVAAIEKQDMAAATDMMHKVEAKAGDCYYIPGRFPHAIGPGNLILEIQEPTDWVVQPERFIEDVELSKTDMWGPLDPAVGMECFDYTGLSLEEAFEKTKLIPQKLSESPAATHERIAPFGLSECFRIEKLTIKDEAEFTANSPYHIGIITGGSGTISCNGREFAAKRGEYYLASRNISGLKFAADPKDPLAVHIISTTPEI